MSECIWSGTRLTLTKPVLAKEYANEAFAQDFFSSTLGIRDATCEDILTELDLMSRRYYSTNPGSLSSDSWTPQAFYEELCTYAETSSAKKLLR